MADKGKYAGKPDPARRKRAGKYIKACRERAGLTQLQLARMLGYDYPTYVSQIENGQGSLPENQYADTARIMQVNPKEFTKRLLAFYHPDVYRILFGSGGATSPD